MSQNAYEQGRRERAQRLRENIDRAKASLANVENRTYRKECNPMATTGEKLVEGSKYTPLRTLAKLAVAVSVAMGAAGCGGGESASVEGNNGTGVADATETTPGATPKAESLTSSDELPHRVTELMQMTPEEIFQLPPEEQAIYQTWQLAHPIHADTSNFQTTVLEGWDPNFDQLNEEYNPLTNPADWNDSDEEIVAQLQFMVDAAYAQIAIDPDEGLDYIDTDAAQKMLQLYYGVNVGSLDQLGADDRIVHQAIASKLAFLQEMGDKVRPSQFEFPPDWELIPGTGEERDVITPDGEHKRARSFSATEQDTNGNVHTYRVTVIMTVLPTYDDRTTAVWQIVETEERLS